MSIRISIIVPVLNESAGLEKTLLSLQSLLLLGDHELLVVDGGSLDDTVAIAKKYADKVITGEQGRARQMNAGAHEAKGDILWFLHADTIVPEQADQAIIEAMGETDGWGRFDIRLSSGRWPFRVIEWLMNLRSHYSGIATGDQGIFVQRELFDRVGGFNDIPLMEDIELSKILKHYARPSTLRQRLTTSSRRWERNGILSTVILMWYLRLAYYMGKSPVELARIYRREPTA
jgi:rSAM/selenodomain-associated transferase 2